MVFKVGCLIESGSFLLFLPVFGFLIIYLNSEGLVFHVGSEVVD